MLKRRLCSRLLLLRRLQGRRRARIKRRKVLLNDHAINEIEMYSIIYIYIPTTNLFNFIIVFLGATPRILFVDTFNQAVLIR